MIFILWNVWNSRNNLISRGLSEAPKLVWERAMDFGRDFQIFNLNNIAMLSRETRPERWLKLPEVTLKVNVYAALIDRKAGLGFVTIDSDGFVHEGGMQFMDNVTDAMWRG